MCVCMTVLAGLQHYKNLQDMICFRAEGKMCGSRIDRVKILNI